MELPGARGDRAKGDANVTGLRAIAANLADMAWTMASSDDSAIDRETHVTCAFSRLDTSVGRICEQFGDSAGYFKVEGLEALTDREIEQAATLAINLINNRN